MPRGKKREKIIVSAGESTNRKVFVRYWTDTGLFDVGFPDRTQDGFALTHFKGIPRDDMASLLECLAEMKREGILKKSQ